MSEFGSGFEQDPTTENTETTEELSFDDSDGLELSEPVTEDQVDPADLEPGDSWDEIEEDEIPGIENDTEDIQEIPQESAESPAFADTDSKKQPDEPGESESRLEKEPLDRKENRNDRTIYMGIDDETS